MKKPYTNMGLKGTVVDDKGGLRALFYNFLITDYSQSNLRLTHIPSFKKILSEASESLDKLPSRLEQYLTDMLKEYFNVVTVIVTVDDNEDGDVELAFNIEADTARLSETVGKNFTDIYYELNKIY